MAAEQAADKTAKRQDGHGRADRERQPAARDPAADADRARPQQDAPPAHARGHAGRARHDRQDRATSCAWSTTRPESGKTAGAANSDAAQRASRTIPARASCACASAAASAPAWARRAAAAARARPRAPACASAASRAARCRCIGACPSAASTSATARTSTRSTSARLQQAVDDRPPRRRQAGRRRCAAWRPAWCAARWTACACWATASSRPSWR